MKALVLGNLEQNILQIIWSKPEAQSVREVIASLAGEPAYTTVMTVMSRMVKKGLLRRKIEGKSYLYEGVEAKSEFANHHLGSIYLSLVSNYGDLAISQFVDSLKGDQKNIKLLEEYLAENE